MAGSLRTVKLREVAELNPRVVDALRGDDQVSFIPMSAVDADTASTVDSESRFYSEVSKGYTPFLDGDLLVAKITPCFENGKIAQARLSRRVGFGSTEFHVVRPLPDRLDARYLLHFLRQKRVRLDGERKMTGSAGQRRVPEHFIAGLTVPLPPLLEQRRIAKILDRAEALRAKRHDALALLDSFTQAIFLDMFGDPATNPKGWSQSAIRDCTALVQIGPFGSLLHRDDYISGGMPLVNPVHIQGGGIVPDPTQSVSARKYAELAIYHLRAGDVIMGRRGEMGRVAIVSAQHDGMVCGTGSLFIRPDRERAIALYLAATLSSHSIRRRLDRFSLGQTLPNLNRRIVETLLIPVPPVALQCGFAHRVAAVEKLKAAHRASLAEMDALFASLQYRAFRGEL